MLVLLLKLLFLVLLLFMLSLLLHLPRIYTRSRLFPVQVRLLLLLLLVLRQDTATDLVLDHLAMNLTVGHYLHLNLRRLLTGAGRARRLLLLLLLLGRGRLLQEWG